MIARSWHGRVPATKAEAYYQYLLRTGLADYRATAGNRGVQVLRRVRDGIAEYQLVTLWDSLESIRAFAGPDPEVARYYPEDDDYLLEREPFVAHYEVLSGGVGERVETARIAGELVMAFEGDTWSGRPIREIVATLSPERAASHPIPGALSPWQLLGHITVWLETARIRLGGRPHDPTEAENFPSPARVTEEEWTALWRRTEAAYRGLAADIEALPDGRLEDPVPGKGYSVYHLLHGVIQHSLYHAGQIALLARG
jgi:heme-degrading monooxygenase HmoA